MVANGRKSCWLNSADLCGYALSGAFVFMETPEANRRGLAFPERIAGLTVTMRGKVSVVRQK